MPLPATGRGLQEGFHIWLNYEPFAVYLARLCIISGQDARTTRNFWRFYFLEVSKDLNFTKKRKKSNVLLDNKF